MYENTEWESFIQRYNDLILAVIRKMIRDHDEVMDAYAFALEKLREKQCQRLSAYFLKPRQYNYEVWIAIVVKNCCMDWFRAQKGRRRLLKCIQELPMIDQCIFRYRYWQGYSYDMIFELLKNKHQLDISFEEMCSHIDQVDRRLQQSTRWQLYQDWHAILPPLSVDDLERTGGGKPSGHPLADPAASPQELLEQQHLERTLNEILHSLDPQQQLLIQLHIYRNLTLEETARVLKMKNLWRVSRKLQKALKLMRKQLAARGIDLSDFEDM